MKINPRSIVWGIIAALLIGVVGFGIGRSTIPNTNVNPQVKLGERSVAIPASGAKQQEYVDDTVLLNKAVDILSLHTENANLYNRWRRYNIQYSPDHGTPGSFRDRIAHLHDPNFPPEKHDPRKIYAELQQALIEVHVREIQITKVEQTTRSIVGAMEIYGNDLPEDTMETIRQQVNQELASCGNLQVTESHR